GPPCTNDGPPPDESIGRDSIPTQASAMNTAGFQRHPSRRRRILTAAAVLAAGALALAGCAGRGGGGGDTGGDGGGGDELEKITVVSFLPLESFTFTPEMYAYAGGFFEKHGLDVELQPVKGTAAAIQSVLGGAALITRASTVDTFPALEKGQP